MISLVCCYFLLFSVVFAFNVSIYNGADYRFNRDPVPVHRLENKIYEFVYHLNETLLMDVLLKNKAPDVIATFYITNQTVGGTLPMKPMTICKEGDCLSFRNKLNSQFISIGMQLNRGTAPCATHIISGASVSLSSTTSEHDLCVETRLCVIVIDLHNECGDSNDLPEQSTSTYTQNKVYIYVISSVIVMCVLVLATCLCVKKFRNRSLDPEDTLELNTYATTNEVLYADLSFVQGNKQTTSHEEEPAYAKIIGVLHPKQ